MTNENPNPMANTIAIVCQTIKSPEIQKQISDALPPGVALERFTRTLLVAVQNNPNAIDGCDKPSLYNAIVKAAADGLMADGREGALIAYNTNIAPKGAVKKYAKIVRWMPMAAGLTKRMADFGITIDTQLVCKNDFFQVELGDEQKIVHRPPPLGADRGDYVGVYAIARAVNGAKYREIMEVSQVEQVRQASQTPDNGPWVDWWGEMARKTVLRRLSKRLPLSEELVRMVSAEDDLFEFNKDRAPAPSAATAVDLRAPEKAAPAAALVAPAGGAAPIQPTQPAAVSGGVAPRGGGHRPSALAKVLEQAQPEQTAAAATNEQKQPAPQQLDEGERPYSDEEVI